MKVRICPYPDLCVEGRLVEDKRYLYRIVKVRMLAFTMSNKTIIFNAVSPLLYNIVLDKVVQLVHILSELEDVKIRARHYSDTLRWLVEVRFTRPNIVRPFLEYSRGVQLGSDKMEIVESLRVNLHVLNTVQELLPAEAREILNFLNELASKIERHQELLNGFEEEVAKREYPLVEFYSLCCSRIDMYEPIDVSVADKLLRLLEKHKVKYRIEECSPRLITLHESKSAVVVEKIIVVDSPKELILTLLKELDISHSC